MAKVLIINKQGAGISRGKEPSRITGERWRVRPAAGSWGGTSLIGTCFMMVFMVVFSGAFYLFQVNDLAVKGYDVRDLETRISQLEDENKQMQIREMELRSMYQIEKSAQDFNLVSPTNVSYLTVDNTLALR